MSSTLCKTALNVNEDSSMQDPPSKPTQMLRTEEVMSRAALGRSAIDDLGNPTSPSYDPSFPRKRKLTRASVRYVESEIESWLVNRPLVTGDCNTKCHS